MINTFKFGKGAKVKHGAYHYPVGHTYKIPQKPEPPPPAMLQGKPIGSVQEWRFALALMHYDLSFEYQLSIAGGRTRRGGMVLDFMVHTSPLWTPVHIVGLYWHSGQNKLDDELRRHTLMTEYKGSVREPIYIYDTQLTTVEEAYKIVQKEMITG